MAAAIALAIGFGPRAARQWELLRVQAACLRAELPADRPAFEGDYLHHVALTARFPGEYEYDADEGLRRVDARWAAMEKLLVRRGFVVRSGAGFAPYSPGGTAFLHERFTPSGRRRLVVVELGGLDDGVTVIDPAGWFSPPRLIGRGAFELDDATGRALEGLKVGRRVQYGAGAADPADRSAFTVVMTLAGVSATVDCRLGDDDRVTVALRDPTEFAGRVLAAVERTPHYPLPVDAAGLTARLDERFPPIRPRLVDAPRINPHIVSTAGASLSDVLEFIRDETPVYLCVNWRSLRGAGVEPDATVRLNMVRPTLRALLDATLGQVQSARGGAQYAVEDNVVIVWAAGAPRPVVTMNLPRAGDREVPEVNFDSAPFADVIGFLEDVCGVRFRVDSAALARAGIAADSPVTLRLRDAPRLSTIVKFVLIGTAGDLRVPLRCFEDGGGLVITAGADR